ncbi:hypothetical protein AXF42_Ash001439 [Apostasia shenzhenica]|uniref:Uncharacterized protein n=1 Tax=Apostasia shenzhenica TaxID=1088818 RepID=A0A2I0AUW8_9ASPA|nr:hypothetical protein AXF42_Ash001439 [Apostasia shenzhenica]
MSFVFFHSSCVFYSTNVRISRVLASVRSSVKPQETPQRIRVLQLVDEELKKGNEREALSLVKDLQGKPSGLQCFGAARQIPQRLYSLDELKLNGIDTSFLSPVDNTLGSIEKSLLVTAALGGASAWLLLDIPQQQVFYVSIGVLFLWSLDLISFNGGMWNLVLDTIGHNINEKYHNRVIQNEGRRGAEGGAHLLHLHIVRSGGSNLGMVACGGTKSFIDKGLPLLDCLKKLMRLRNWLIMLAILNESTGVINIGSWKLKSLVSRRHAMFDLYEGMNERTKALIENGKIEMERTHEAGHFLIAYLLGVLPKGYMLSSLEAFRKEGSLNVQAGTAFVDFEFVEAMLNQFSCIALAGVATEYLLFGYSEGGLTDIKELDVLLKSLGFTQKKTDSVVRFAVLNTVLMLRRHERVRSQLAEAMAAGTAGQQEAQGNEKCDGEDF